MKDHNMIERANKMLAECRVDGHAENSTEISRLGYWQPKQDAKISNDPRGLASSTTL